MATAQTALFRDIWRRFDDAAAAIPDDDPPPNIAARAREILGRELEKRP